MNAGKNTHNFPYSLQKMIISIATIDCSNPIWEIKCKYEINSSSSHLNWIYAHKYADFQLNNFFLLLRAAAAAVVVIYFCTELYCNWLDQ